MNGKTSGKQAIINTELENKQSLIMNGKTIEKTNGH